MKKWRSAGSEEGVVVSELQYGRHGENVTPGYLGLLVLACLLFLRDVTKIKGGGRERKMLMTD